MKNKLILPLITFALLNHFAHGMIKSDSTNKSAIVSTVTPEAVQKQLVEITDQLTEVKKLIKDNSKGQTERVGVIGLKKQKGVLLYSDINYKLTVPNVTVDIDSVLIMTKDGYIVSVQVVTKNGVFINGLAPIEISNSRLNSVDGLALLVRGEYQYIYTNEIFSYISLKPHIPDNADFVLSKRNPAYTFTKGVGLNTIFDLRLYSDALGVLGGKANGLVQTDAYFKQFIHRTNVFNRGVFLANYVKFNLNASKFDSKVAYTDSSKFTRASLFQKSWLNADLAVNLINGWITKRSLNSYYLDLGAGVSLSNLAKKKDTVVVTTTSIFLQPGVDINVSDNIGFAFSARILWTYSPQTDFNNQQSERVFIKPTFGIYWNPMGNEASRIFGRVSYNIDPTNQKENLFQLQFGYSLQLTSLVK